MKHVKLIIVIFASLILISCESGLLDTPAELNVHSIHIKQTHYSQALDLPNGMGIFVDYNFSINDPSTWTGNVAKYVNNNYMYEVYYSIENLGGDFAYDVEVDLEYRYSNGDSYTKTIYIGEIAPNQLCSYNDYTGCTNKQLTECRAEVFWYDY